MSAAPNVLTQEVLTQRQAAPMVMVQSEEILRTRTPAYSKTNSDISFLVRQPSASAILRNQPELYLELEFTLSDATDVVADYTGGQSNLGLQDNKKYRRNIQINSDYGFYPEMLPLQNKCIRNMVININGASQSIRCNEFGSAYCKMHASRDYMEKIGGGINDFKFKKLIDAGTPNNNITPYHCQSDSEENQYRKWKNQMLQDKSVIRQQGTTTPKLCWREPLYCGVFGAFTQCEAFPAWSCEKNKSSGLLHVHNMQINCAMEENWWRSLYLQTYCFAKASGMASVTGVTIKTAELFCEWVQPPPRLVGASIGAQISYATSDVLRFVADYKADNGSDVLHAGDKGRFELQAVSFPYMPNLFVFECGPHYAHKTEYIGGQTTKAQGALFDMKKDVRMAITHIDLIVNTSNQAVPFKGTTDVQSVRINAYDLYKMTLANCYSMEKFPHSFEEWLQGGCFVALSPAQLNGVLNSPSIRGNVTVQGSVYVKNMSRTPVNCGKANQAWTTNHAGTGIVFQNGANMERYQLLCSGMYSNRMLTLDAKSGIVSEATFSEAFAQSLRLGSSA